MTLKQTLTDDMKQAMRDRDTLRLGTIRFLLAEIKNFEIDHGEQDDAGIEKIMSKQLKQIKEGMVEYKKAGRDELVAEEEQKAAVLQSYLPKPMTDEELEKIIKEVIGQIDDPQMGPVIGLVKKKVGSRAEGGKIAGLVKQLL